MEKKKNSRRKVVFSMLALIVAVAMLIGTTLAWFTDSVTSGKNQVTAGNLDIEVYHTSKITTEETKIDDKTDLFKDVTLWEPGAVSYENIEVRNVGTLAAKYKLNLNVADKNTLTTDNVAHDLSEVIKVAVVEGGFTGGREEAMALEGYVPLADFQRSGSLAALTGKDKYGIVLYWEPSEKDNLYNANNGKVTSDGQPLFIDLGINVTATQDTVEKDSFDDQYDAMATFPVSASTKIEAGKETKITAYDENNQPAVKAVIPADAPALAGYDRVEMTVAKASKPDDIELGVGDSAFTLDVKFYGIDTDGKRTPITDFGTSVVIVDLSKELPEDSIPGKVYHTHSGVSTELSKADSKEAVGKNQYFYDEETKLLTIGSTTFSPITFVIHTHEFDTTKWSYDGTHHWHAALCEHTDVVKDKEEHSYDEKGECICTRHLAVTGVTVSPTTLEFTAVGDTDVITATVTPENAYDKSVTWSSDNTKVATVEDGVVTAQGAGTAKITATTVDGGKTAVCDVTVTIETSIAIYNSSAGGKTTFKNITSNNKYYLAEDITVSESVSNKDYDWDNVTIDLRGHKMTFQTVYPGLPGENVTITSTTGKGTLAGNYIYVKGNNFTLENVNFNSASDGLKITMSNNSHYATVKNCYLKSSSTSSVRGAVYVNKGILNVENTELVSGASNSYCFYPYATAAGAKAVLNIKAGCTLSGNTAFYNTGTYEINISGGNYTCSKLVPTGVAYNNLHGKLNITGGTFNFDPNNCTDPKDSSKHDFVPAGYHSTNNGDGTYTVSAD